MTIHRNKILVIDDREDHGVFIARALWKKQIPVIFFHYDEESLLELQDAATSPQHHGVRAILLDINLSNSGSAGHADYVRAENIINTLLHKNNGPWTLITWSTFGGNHPAELFAHLSERLPDNLKPLSLMVLNKEQYVDPTDNYSIQSGENQASLDESIRQVLTQPKALNILRQWETSVYACASEVVKKLAEPAFVQARESEQLSHLLLATIIELAKADAGATLDDNDISDPLYNVLGPLLLDRIIHSTPSAIAITEEEKINLMPGGDWRYRLNSMLHWDVSQCVNGKTSPGTVFIYPKAKGIPKTLPLITQKGRYEFLENNFIEKSKVAALPPANRKKLEKDCTLVLMDITPPCDYAQNKAVWRTFILGVKVSETHRKFFYKTKNADITDPRKPLQTKGDFIFNSPPIKPNDTFFEFFFNSKLTICIPEGNNALDKLGIPIGRIREQLLRDIMSWLGHQITRPGILKL